MILQNLSILLVILTATTVNSFSPHQKWKSTCVTPISGGGSQSESALYAIGVLARKGKEMEVKKYVESGEMEESTTEWYNKMKDALDSVTPRSEPGPVQSGLTKRKGTISIVAEYRRKLSDSGFIDDILGPELLSPTFREFGAVGVSILADNRMGGCDYKDIGLFSEEQRSAKGEVPGPMPVINNDLIVDEVQIARSKAYGASAIVLNYGLLGSEEKISHFIKCASALDMETIVAVSSKEQSQSAVNSGASILMVTGLESSSETNEDIVAEKWEVVQGLTTPDDSQIPLCIGASISNRAQNSDEIEEAWKCRDSGFNFIFVADGLYRGGNDPTEHCGAIIKAMAAKSSVKWASAKTLSGKGEGAREYLGDIMM